MTFSWPDLIPKEPLVTPHQLCRCCRRLADTVVQVSLPERYGYHRMDCEHYDSLQDLIDGARGGCHACNIAIDNFKKSYWRITKQRPLWLQSHEGEVTDDRERLKIETTLLTGHEKEATIVDLMVNDGHQKGASFLINFRSPAWTPRIAHSEAQLSSHVASDAHFDLIQRWIGACTDKARHPMCNMDGQFRKPTRLLDLSRYSEDVTLINGEDSKSPYATLSYSWGEALQLKTVRSNLKEFQQRITFNQLSRVAQDAIRVCRKLSILYIWIDALCIVQGGDGDFSTEAPRMHDVYAGSLLTISAADSKDTTESFLGYRNPLPWLECTLEGTSPGRAEKHFKVEPSRFCKSSMPGKYHIDSRAWCLQERFMSPRGIFFGLNGIHWECRRGLACEIDLKVREKHFHETSLAYRMKSGYAELQSMQSQSRSNDSRKAARERRKQAYQMWSQLVNAYSKMHLSHIEDGLIAISGIASVFEPLLQSECTYGMWICRMSEELLWRTENGPKKSPGEFLPYLPSWSWISAYDRKIYMPSGLWDFEFIKEVAHIAQIVSWSSDAGFNTRLLQGPRDIRICIKGYLVPYSEACAKRKNRPRSRGVDGDIDASTKGIGREPSILRRRLLFYSDFEEIAGTTLFCLLLRCKNHGGRYTNEGLALTPVDPSERIYRRAGIIEEKHPASDFPNAPPSSFVRGKYLVDLWAPLEEEQEIYII